MATVWLKSIGWQIPATISTNEKQNQNQSWLARSRFPALNAGYASFPKIPIY